MSEINKNKRSMNLSEEKEDNNVKNNEINGKSKSEDMVNNDMKKSTNCESNELFGFSSSPTMEDIRKIHAKFTSDRNWDQFHTPRNILLALVGEIGELSELFQWKNECDIGLKDWTQTERTALEEELSDVLIYLIRLADRCRVDLPHVVVQKFKKNENKYPIDKVFGSSKKYTEYQ